MRAQDLKIGGFGTEFRCGAIGTREFAQKVQKCRKSKKTRNIGKVKPCKIMFFGLTEAHMGAQDLKIGGFGAEFRDEAIGIGLRT